MRRAWERGREESLGTGCHVSFTIAVHRELKTHFHFVAMETGINFVGVYLISMFVCLLKLAHVANFFLSDFGKLLDKLQPLFYMPFLIQFAWNFITTIA